MGATTLTEHATLGLVRKITVDFVAEANGAIASLVLPRIDGRLMELITNPGSTAPTDNYDITLVDGEGIDRLQGVGANRDTTNTESAIPVYSGSTIHPVVSRADVLTLTFANNSQNAAVGRVILYYGPA